MNQEEWDLVKKAWATSFYEEGNSGSCLFNDLSFLRLADGSKYNAIRILKNIVDSQPGIQKDIRICLEAKYFRPQLIACLALIYKPDPDLIDDLWSAIKNSSWVAPQLCITAFHCDKNFKENALATVKNGEIYHKHILPLYLLLNSACSYDLSEHDNERIASARDQDVDGLEKIVRDWFTEASRLMKLKTPIKWVELS